MCQQTLSMMFFMTQYSGRLGTSTCCPHVSWVSSTLTMICPIMPSTVLLLLRTETLSSRGPGCKHHRRSEDRIITTFLMSVFQYYIINHSVFHRDFPNKKGFVRGLSHLTGNCLNSIIFNWIWWFLRVPHHPIGQGMFLGVCGPLWPRGAATGVGHQQAVHHPGPQDGEEAAQGLHQLQQLEG